MVQQDEEIKYSDVYRSLSATVYRVRFFVFRLTDTDLMVCLLTSLAAWYVIDNTGSGQKLFFGLFTLDPWGWIWTGILAALIISFAHKIRPEGEIDRIVRGWLAQKLYAPRFASGDRFWLPADSRLHFGAASEKRDKKRVNDG